MIQSVIIVDDEPADRYIASRILRKAGLEADIHEFPEGLSALDFITAMAKPDDESVPHLRPTTLVLVDINMPRLSGFEFLERLESAMRTSNAQADWIGVMMFTSSANQRDRARADEFSIVRGFIVKPLTVEDVKSLMTQHLVPPTEA